MKRLSIGGAASVLLVAGVALNGGGESVRYSPVGLLAAPKPPPCWAHMSSATPRPNTTVSVKITSWGSTRITTVAYFQSGKVIHQGTTDPRHGEVSIAYAVGGAPVGFTVHSIVWAYKNGRQGHCFTSFTPTLPLTALPLPKNLRPFSLGAPRTDGVWHRAGRPVAGHAAIYETTLQPPGSSYEAGIAWVDTNLLRAQLYSGSGSPGGYGWRYTAPIQPSAALSLVAAFNGGFKFPASQGGYYSEGRLVYPLRNGGASLVIYRNGSATVGQWGRDVTMTRDVVAVRQNLTLLVDHGRAVGRLNPDDTYAWGATLGGVPNVWRSGIGVTANGALVYVYGPSLRITQLAALLVRAGAVRAMTLDMNPYWVVFATYSPSPSTAAASPANGRNLLGGTMQGPSTFFEPSWTRDFFTLSAR